MNKIKEHYSVWIDVIDGEVYVSLTRDGLRVHINKNGWMLTPGGARITAPPEIAFDDMLHDLLDTLHQINVQAQRVERGEQGFVLKVMNETLLVSRNGDSWRRLTAYLEDRITAHRERSRGK